MTTDELAQFLKLELKVAVSEGIADAMSQHKSEHDKLDDKLDSTRRLVWMGGGIFTAVSVGFSKLFGSH